MPNFLMQKMSPEIEEYLETLCRKKERGEPARTTDIAKELGVSAPSVSEMFRKLSDGGFIDHSPYQGAVLLKKGEETGRRILRKHRLIEEFLALVGVKPRRIHAEACVLEHAVSDEVEMSLRNVISARTACMELVPITSLKAGEAGTIMLVDAGTKASKRLADLGLTTGTRVTLVKSTPLGGPVRVAVRSTSLALGRSVASKVFVKAAKGK